MPRDGSRCCCRSARTAPPAGCATARSTCAACRTASTSPGAPTGCGSTPTTALVEEFPIAVGTENTPTPGGEFYIKELLIPTNPDGFYGPYAYGLVRLLERAHVLQRRAGCHRHPRDERAGQHRPRHQQRLHPDDQRRHHPAGRPAARSAPRCASWRDGIYHRGMTSRDAVIVSAVRTPVGKRNGALKDVHPVDLSAHVLEALAERSGRRPRRWSRTSSGARVMPDRRAGLNVGRNAALAAGWPEDVTGVTLDRQCGSSQQAVHFAAAGGHRRALRRRRRRRGRVDDPHADGRDDDAGPGHPVRPEDVRALRQRPASCRRASARRSIAERWGFTRQQVDEFALASHEKAAAAIDDGRFAAQIAPVPPGATSPSTRASAAAAPWRSSARSQPAFKPRTASSPRPTPRRSPTARRRCCS